MSNSEIFKLNEYLKQWNINYNNQTKSIDSAVKRNVEKKPLIEKKEVIIKETSNLKAIFFNRYYWFKL